MKFLILLAVLLVALSTLASAEHHHHHHHKRHVRGACGRKLMHFVLKACGPDTPIKCSTDIATRACAGPVTEDYIKESCCPREE